MSRLRFVHAARQALMPLADLFVLLSAQQAGSSQLRMSATAASRPGHSGLPADDCLLIHISSPASAARCALLLLNDLPTAVIRVHRRHQLVHELLPTLTCLHWRCTPLRQCSRRCKPVAGPVRQQGPPAGATKTPRPRPGWALKKLPLGRRRAGNGLARGAASTGQAFVLHLHLPLSPLRSATH